MILFSIQFVKDFEEVKELEDVINVVQNASFKGIDHAFQNCKNCKKLFSLIKFLYPRL